ncbi:MAG: hypothetical protein AAGB46_15050, partial [Verrucomicrobiota bacterium]
MKCIQILLATLVFFGSSGCGKSEKIYEVGLSMYSLRQLFESRGGDLDALDYPKFAKETFGITEIDVWDGGFPEDKRKDP